jgi:hypothetical protein
MKLPKLPRYIALIGAFLVRVPQALAEELPTYKDTDVATLGSLEVLFSNAIRTVVSLTAVGLFLMFIVGGFSFLFSAGDQKKLEQARGTLTNAIIGLVVVVSAYLILRVIGTFTGTLDTITTFKILQ